MLVYLIRHADAVPAGSDGAPTDEERPLTPNGEAQCKAIAATMLKHGVHLDRIFHSPLVRAKQTAAGIAQNWTPTAPQLVESDHLEPGGRYKKLGKELGKHASQSVAAVGHMPDIAELASWLIGSKKARLDLSKAGIACIALAGKFDKGEGILQWLVTDAWLSSEARPEPAHGNARA
jgi:phosphohistidine phosphatase